MDLKLQALILPTAIFLSRRFSPFIYHWYAIHWRQVFNFFCRSNSDKIIYRDFLSCCTSCICFFIWSSSLPSASSIILDIPSPSTMDPSPSIPANLPSLPTANKMTPRKPGKELPKINFLKLQQKQPRSKRRRSEKRKNRNTNENESKEFQRKSKLSILMFEKTL